MSLPWNSKDPDFSASIITWRVGFWSAVLCALFSLLYIVFQLAEWLGLLGSDGGPESASTPLGLVLLLTPSLLLAPSFIVLMLGARHLIPEGRRIWGEAGVAFAIVYATLIGIVYYVQLTLVLPRMLEDRTEDIGALLFIPFDSFLYSVDLLGYSFMSLATLVAAFGLMGVAHAGVARAFLLANGLLLPFLLFQIYINGLIYIAALWAVTFPGAAIALAMVSGVGGMKIRRSDDGWPEMMSLFVLFFQVLLPIVLLGWLGVFAASGVVAFTLQALSVGLVLLDLGLVGLWAMPPFWVPYLYGLVH